jgi:hypothetical protein
MALARWARQRLYQQFMKLQERPRRKQARIGTADAGMGGGTKDDGGMARNIALAAAALPEQRGD